MDEGLGTFFFLLIGGIVVAIIALRSGSSGKLNELIFQLRVMQKQLEGIAETLKGIREENALRQQQGVATEVGDTTEAKKKGMETQPEADENIPIVEQTIQPTDEIELTEDVPGAAEEVVALGEQQRVGSAVTTIEVPVQPIDTPTSTVEADVQHEAVEPQHVEDGVADAETLAENDANAVQEDAEKQDDNTEPQGCDVEEALENEPQMAPQEHEPVAAFVQDETAEEHGEAEQEQIVAGKDYLEAKHEQADAKHDNTSPYGGNAYGMNQTADDDNESGFNYEKFIGENLFGKIGILVFVLGIGFFVKYAIDQNWISHTMRTVLSYAVGTVLLGIGWKLSKRYRTFSSLLAGGGCAVYYVTTAIAYHYYQLFSQPLGFGIMVFVTLFMAWVSHHYDRRELAVTALVGGFLAPFLVGTESPNFLFLYVYMAILNLGSLYLSWSNRWNELPLISTGATFLVLLIAMFGDFVDPYALHVTFYGLFWLIATMSCFAFLRRGMTDIFTGFHIGAMILSSVFTIVLVSSLGRYGNYDSAVTALVMGLVYIALHLWLRQSEQRNGVTQSVLLALGLAYLSISLPLFFSGAVLTICFAAEMVLLLWLYCRLEIRIYGIAAILALIINTLSLIATLFGRLDFMYDVDVQNFNFIAEIFRGLCFLAFARIMDRNQERVRDLYVPWNLVIYIIGIAALYCAIYMEMDLSLKSSLYNAGVTLLRTTALLAIALGFGRRFPAGKFIPLYMAYMALGLFFIVSDVFIYGDFDSPAWAIILQWLGIACTIALYAYSGKCYYKQVKQAAAYFTVFLNLTSTVLWVCMVRALLIQIGIEQFSAAFSLALAAVGTVQMTLGMRLPNKTMRLLSIGTFIFIIAKLALYDVWRMPAIGRIVVFIILGALLLTLSFLYQKLKDTLNLGGEDEEPNPLDSEPTQSDDEAQDLSE